MKCNKCKQGGVGFIDVLANSVSGKVRCYKCGAMFSLPAVKRVIYLIIEGVVIFIAAVFSLAQLSAIYLVVALFFSLVFRGVGLKRCWQEVKTAKKMKKIR
ncbi:hypothetical protein N480_14035 [Pseudoalteromonas luteoviolacea S2607]|nr:hypothetical protein N480_14035 [Pseudoalteromonas luteoviolacea S2607]